MSRTIRGSKGSGYDYQSKRHPNSACMSSGKVSKMITRQYERARKREYIHSLLENTEEE